MQKHIILILIIAILSANAFLFDKKPKDGCNPNPCKHKSECVKDKVDPNKFGSCKCLPGFYGVHCEKKDGCYSKPCKSGTCVVNRLNQANYTCTCPPGRVGARCEKADECAKNPCKNNGTCKLDANLRATCTCLNGWGSKHCDKRNCTIVEFKGKHFTKLPKVYIDSAVEPAFKKFDEFAKKCKVTVQPIKSYTPQVKQLVSPQDAPHYIGRALTFELQDENGRLLCNSICLGKKPLPLAPAQCFVDEVVKFGWKWDQNHQLISDNLYISNPLTYNKLRQTAQVGCKDKVF